MTLFCGARSQRAASTLCRRTAGRTAVVQALSLYILLVATALAQTPAKPAHSIKDLKFPALAEVRIPKVTEFTLPNGMKVFLLEHHELPLVSGGIRVHTGSVYEPADKAGLASLTGTVLRSGGTKDKTGDQIDEELENVAASVESAIGQASGSLSFNTLKEHTDAVLDVFYALLTAPEFRQEKVDLAKTQTRSAISRRNDQAQSIMGREFRELIYGPTTPWGRRSEYETIDRITRDDMVAFHKRYYFPANAILYMYGDFTVETMRPKLEKMFGAWTVKQAAVPPLPPVDFKPAPGVYLAAKSDVAQTFFAMGHLGGTLKDKDYPALEVAANILGGAQIGRLYQKIRTQMGLAYSVSASWDANFSIPGPFQISGSTKSPSTVETIQTALAEVNRLRSAEVTDQELETAKNSELNSFVFHFEHPRSTLDRLVTYEFFGYPRDFLFQYQKAVGAVTKADVLRVAKQHFKPEEMVIVAVGKPEDFGKPLTALNLPVKNIDLKIPEPKKAESASDSASLAQGKTLLQRLQKAVGGADRIAGIKDYSNSAEVAIFAAGPTPMKAKRVTRVAPPHLRQDQELPFGKVAVYSDGKSGWLSTPQGMQPIPDAAQKQVKEEMFRSFRTLWISDRDPERVVNAVGTETIEISDREGHSVRITLDPQSGLPVKQSYRSMGAGGGPSEVEETFSDWKEIEGIKLPFKVAVMQGDRKVTETTVIEIKINSGLKPEELAQKP